MTDNTENFDLIQAAQDAVDPYEITDGLYIVTDREGDTQVIDQRAQLQDALALDHPRRKNGAFTVTDVPSFAAYLTKHGIPETELWGARDAGYIRAVINAHDGITGEDDANADPDGQIGKAGWGDHTITLALRHSDDWRDWTKNDGQWMTQDVFAEFVEAHLPNFGDPNGAEALELARSFKATQKVEFGTTRHAGGETTLSYVETTDAKAGKKGDITFPDRITLALQVYDQGKPYPLAARLRYRVRGGELAMGYLLDRPKDTLDQAFTDVAEDVETQTSRQVWSTT